MLIVRTAMMTSFGFVYGQEAKDNTKDDSALQNNLSWLGLLRFRETTRTLGVLRMQRQITQQQRRGHRHRTPDRPPGRGLLRSLGAGGTAR